MADTNIKVNILRYERELDFYGTLPRMYGRLGTRQCLQTQMGFKYEWKTVKKVRRAKTKEAFQIEGDQQDVTSDLKCTPG